MQVNLEPTNKPIGGFLELERPNGCNAKIPSNAVNSGRSGLELILRQYRPAKLWIPAFVCNCVREFLATTEQPYECYHVNGDLELDDSIDLASGEMLLYVNYFGVKDAYCNTLQAQYGASLILDLTQAFFYQPHVTCPSFSSFRKFFGVPDGGLVTGVYQESIDALPVASAAEYAAHLIYRADGRQEDAYTAFQANEERFCTEHPLRVSNLTCHILQGVNLNDIGRARQRNYRHLHQALKTVNHFVIPETIVPLSYPLLVADGDAIRKKLIASSIFIPKYWPALEQLNNDEQNAVNNIIHLPIDQRYGIDEMNIILEMLI